LLLHCDRRAASRAACTAGKSRAIKIPMMAMTTKSSTSVKAGLFALKPHIDFLRIKKKTEQRGTFLKKPNGTNVILFAGP
jgi:hypothetical protein